MKIPIRTEIPFCTISRFAQLGDQGFWAKRDLGATGFWAKRELPFFKHCNNGATFWGYLLIYSRRLELGSPHLADFL